VIETMGDQVRGHTQNGKDNRNTEGKDGRETEQTNVKEKGG
jgi:hypothetical protein